MLVSYLGEVKIVDFGIAKASSIVSQTAVGILKGKYGYMSPEQARGQPVDARSDIFNTGIVLYEMLVGERCFAGSSDFSTLNLMRNAEVTPPTQVNAQVPKSLEAIVLKALSRKKEDRPQTALELDQILGEWARKESAVATKGDLATFMRGLFRDGQVKQNGPSTGVIEVKSVEEPPSAAVGADLQAVAPRRGTERAASLANRPVEAPPPEADPGQQPSAASDKPARAHSLAAANAVSKQEKPAKSVSAPARPKAKAAGEAPRSTEVHAQAGPGQVVDQPQGAGRAAPSSPRLVQNCTGQSRSPHRLHRRRGADRLRRRGHRGGAHASPSGFARERLSRNGARQPAGRRPEAGHDPGGIHPTRARGAPRRRSSSAPDAGGGRATPWKRAAPGRAAARRKGPA